MAFTASMIIGGLVGAAGIGTSIFGMSKQQEGYAQEKQGLALEQQGYTQETALANTAAGYNTNIVTDQQNQQQINMTAMELDAKRQSTQIIRNSQSARAMAIAGATAQGAGFAGGTAAATGLLGGLAQVKGDTSFNLNGVSQALQAGKQMFASNEDISQNEILLAQNQGQMATAQGLVAQGSGMVQGGQGVVSQGAGYMSLGSSLVSASSIFGNIAGNFGGMSLMPSGTTLNQSGGFGFPGGSLTG